MTDRITPLPWIMSEAGNGTAKVVGIDGLNVVTCHYSINEPSVDEANAAYIVHCANNYPKLEALSAELVEKLKWFRENIVDSTYSAEFRESLEDLIQKAKGVASND